MPSSGSWRHRHTRSRLRIRRVNAGIVLLPGDGIGPEVVAAAVRVLTRVGERFGHTWTFTTTADWRRRAARGPAAAARRHAARPRRAPTPILLGAVGDPAFDDRPPAERPEAALLAHSARAWRLRESAAGARRGRGSRARAAQAGGARRHRPGRRPRADGRAVLRPAARDRRGRSVGGEHDALHARRNRARRAGRVQAGANRGAAGSCRWTRPTCSRSRGSGATSSPRSRAISRRHADARARRCRGDEAGARAGDVRRDAHREHVRRHPLGRSRRRLRIARAAAVGQPRRRRRTLRARARLGAGPGGQGHRESDRRDCVGRDAACRTGLA